jgi:hypothetical protein
MLPSSERTAILVVFFLVGSAFAANEIHKDFHFKVHFGKAHVGTPSGGERDSGLGQGGD